VFVTRLAAALAALLAIACAAPIRTELPPEDAPKPVQKVAVMPLRADPLFGSAPAEAPVYATGRVIAALESDTQLRVVDPSDADAILTGFVRRWVERDGSASGVRHPASVWLVLELRDRDGRLTWKGTYEETQAPLSDDLGSLPRAWERGFRWVTASELAEYGARELVRELAREAKTWS
jgi:hypothetical protein